MCTVSGNEPQGSSSTWFNLSPHFNVYRLGLSEFKTISKYSVAGKAFNNVIHGLFKEKQIEVIINTFAIILIMIYWR